MKYTRRELKLVALLHKETGTNLKRLAVSLAVTPETVKTELKKMEPAFSEYGIKILMEKGGHIEVAGREALPRMRQEIQLQQVFSLEKSVMLLLVLESGFVTLQDMADKLFVSKSLLEKVMPPLLAAQEGRVESIRRHGIRYSGTSLERRSEFSRLLRDYLMGIDYLRELNNFSEEHFPLFSYLDEVSVQEAAAGMDVLNHAFFRLTDEASIDFFLELLIACHTRKSGQPVVFGSLPHEVVMMSAERSHYLKLGDEIAQSLHLAGKAREEEAEFIAFLLLGARKNYVEKADRYQDSMKDVLEAVLKAIHDEQGIDLRKDLVLWEGLALHIQTTIYRHLPIGGAEDAGIETAIREEAPLSYELAVVAARVIYEKLNYEVNPGELTYLALHFAAGLERRQKRNARLSVLVVCHYGIAAANLIAAKIERIFPQLNVVGVYSRQDFVRRQEELSADLLLTTEPLPDAAMETCYVTPLFDEGDRHTVECFLADRSRDDQMLQYLEDAVFLDSSALTMEQVLTEACGELESVGAVTKDYLPSVLAREQASSTALAGIAVPHGKPSEVLHTTLAMVRLKKPVDWLGAEISSFFLFAIAKEDMKKEQSVFKSFYKTLANPELRMQIQQAFLTETPQKSLEAVFVHQKDKRR